MGDLLEGIDWLKAKLQKENSCAFRLIGGKKMKKIYCIKCGKKLNTKFGIVPNRCACGAEFGKWDEHTVKNTVLLIISLFVLMSPFFVVLYFLRQPLRDSFILYAVILVAFMFCFRQAEGVLIRIGILKMTNIEIR